MQKISNALAIGSLMYTQVCTSLDIMDIIGMLGRHLSNSRMDHYRVAKRLYGIFKEQNIICSHIGNPIS